jgi:hypothetical protein
MTLRIYIAGPIAAPGADGGLPTSKEVAARKLKFYEVYNRIRDDIGSDNIVINPLDIPACGSVPTNPYLHAGKPECPSTAMGGVEHSWQCFLRYDLEKLVMCDELVMLPGWEGSPGASVEHKVGKMLGLEIHFWCDVHDSAHPEDGFSTACEGVTSVNSIHP